MPRNQRFYVTCAAAGAAAVLGWSGGCRATGDEPPVPPVPSPLTLDHALRLALASNKDIRIAVVAADQARAAIGLARGEFDSTLFLDASGGKSDEPVASLPVSGSENKEAATRLGVRKRAVTGTEVELSTSLGYTRDETTLDGLDPRYETDLSLILKQDLLRGFGLGVNRTEILVLHNISHMVDEALRGQIMQDLFEVERTYWELSFAMADLEVRGKQLVRAQELVRIAKARVDVGDAPPIEITRAQSSAANQRVSIEVAGNRITKLRHELLQRMGVLAVAHADDAFDLADLPNTNAVAVSLAETMEVAGQLRPELAQVHWALENAVYRERFASNQRLPSLQLYGGMSLLDLDGEFDSNAMVPGEQDYYAWEAGVMLEMPLLNRAAKSNYHVARLERERVGLRAVALVETITREAADAIQEVNTARARMASAGEARALSRRLLEAEEKSFNLGRAESFNVLDAQASLAASERDEVRARSDYAIAVADLYRVRGDLLSVKGIAFAAGVE